ncbi:Hypothetical Protein FCC1311_035422 [Hondaea fermentalgiana]|uniref:Uncharacterized protein n=1 Tax=Hondaea fermentalgiana TaxID=2315210 RepID=A0A2R5G8J2_9STRA|nr:Hypothetical Protein FCC1311_035422 [Hondaea fermentalgiana]|eukprot:GBG27320.1 Hypothetical Protein FCC1311_035422 [Hondaea fermentalgiana]
MGVKRARSEANDRLEQLLAVCAEEQERRDAEAASEKRKLEAEAAKAAADRLEKLRKEMMLLAAEKDLTTTRAVLAMSWAEREVVFRAALERNEEVVEAMLQNCVKTGEALKDSPIVATVVSRQMQSIRALSWVLVAHLASMCGILRTTKDEAASLRHVASVIKTEIKRMGSPKLVFDMLQILIRDLDADLAKHQIDTLIGKVQDAAQRGFGIIKRVIRNPDTHADDRSEASDKTDTHASDVQSAAGEKRPASLAEGFRISRPNHLADLLDHVERAKKRQRQREVVHDFSTPRAAAVAPSTP